MRDYFIFLSILQQKTKHENEQNKRKNANLLLHLPMLQKVAQQEKNGVMRLFPPALIAMRAKRQKAKRNCDRLLGATVNGDQNIFSHFNVCESRKLT